MNQQISSIGESPQGNRQFLCKDLHFFSSIELQSTQLSLQPQIPSYALALVGYDHFPPSLAEFHVAEPHCRDFIFFFQMKVVVGSQHYHNFNILGRIILNSMWVIRGLRVSESLLRFIVNVVFILFEEGLRGLPKGLISKENKLVVHLYGANEDCVLQIVAEIAKDGLQFVLRVFEFMLILIDIIEFFGNEGQEHAGQLMLELSVCLCLLCLFNFECEYLIALIIAIDVGVGVVDKCFLDERRNLDFFFGEHVDHVCDELAIEFSNQLQIGILSLNQILHFQVLVFCQIRVL